MWKQALFTFISSIFGFQEQQQINLRFWVILLVALQIQRNTFSNYMQKSQKGYWYQRNNVNSKHMKTQQQSFTQTKSKNYSSSSIPHNQPKNKNIDSLRKYSWYFTSLQSIQKTLLTINQYFEALLASQSLGKVVSRCFKHNSEIILYCIKDKVCLCAQCMYGTGNNSSKIQPVPVQSIKIDSKSKPHLHHEVLQSSNAIFHIEQDNVDSGLSLKKLLNELKVHENSWKNFQKNLQKQKTDSLRSLQEQYNNQQSALSKKFRGIKEKIEQTTKKYENKCNMSLQALTYIRKVAEPKRLVLPILKHSWFQKLFESFEIAPLEAGKGNSFFNKFDHEKIIRQFELQFKQKFRVLLSQIKYDPN